MGDKLGTLFLIDTVFGHVEISQEDEEYDGDDECQEF